METYRRLETPKLYGIVHEETLGDDGSLTDGALVDPVTSFQIIIKDKAGAIVQALDDMVNISTGKYYYAGYTIAADALTGKYEYELRAIDGSSYAAVIRASFNVEEQIV